MKRRSWDPEPPPPWASESAMLADFVGHARAAGWVVYTEAGGHDLLLVVGPGTSVGAPFKVGDVVAVEGKLGANLRLLAQVTPPTHDTGADWYVAVVPDAGADFRWLARRLGVVVVDWSPPRVPGRRVVDLPARDIHRHWPERRVEVPSLVVDLPAGVPAPRQATRWAIAAVRLCRLALGRESRELTGAEFKAAQVDPRLWLSEGWVVVERRDGRSLVYRLCDADNRPDLRYPEIVDALNREG